MEDDGSRVVHSYRNIIANHNARVHNGDVYTTGPVTVVTTEGKVSNVIDMLKKTTVQVHAIQHERQNVDYTLLNLISQLTALKAALEMIGKWAEADAAEPHHQLQMDLDRCLTGCRVLVAKLDQVTEHIQNCLLNRDLAPSVVETTMSSALAEAEEIQKYIATQINAMNLLLTAFQCNTIAAQNVVLQKRSARKMIRSIEKDTASLLVHTGDVPSSWRSIADAGSNLSIVFPFDQELWTTSVYSRLGRQLMKKVIRHTEHWPVPVSEIQAGLHDSQKDPAGAKLKQRSRATEKALSAEQRRRHRSHNVLIFGNSTEDKDLLMKQFRSVYGDGHSTAELAAHQQSILLHLVTCAKAFIHAMTKLEIAFEDTVLRRLTQVIMDSEDSIEPEVISAVAKLCQEANVHKILESQEEIVLPRFAAYFLIAAERMTTVDYLPTEADVQRITSGRSGIYEETFAGPYNEQTQVTVLGHLAQMPRNMLQSFPHNITSIVFLADLAEYDTSDFENAYRNRLLESLLLFEAITGSGWPYHITILVLLTNLDNFKRKLISKPLEHYFHDYTGGTDPNRAVEYVSKRFD
ncbi:Guanine nucleotide-binding protein alpha-2 subunit [Elasticomyces elasticus]|nr:Guanine nucleotide-binding protein alpha-2 subunit [Elasticomyces elasticus]KAK3624876.1 Guanine nucleotide-binding protein alpha-2 subunit [Elasticomyces elasticus]KAK4906558.1 Guanine nucleotide-binding protein alpha-2 subunit [Elasticomyces elasticus]KAK5745387.1 Guanine nucleotide-binding protein alpha-2 subunit [Elasticomyces elasticus]